MVSAKKSIRHQHMINRIHTCDYRLIICSLFFVYLYSGGIHAKKKCDAGEKVQSIKKQLADNWQSLFPEQLHMESGVSTISQLKPKANGGWGDPRDRILCRQLASGSYSEIMEAIHRSQVCPLLSPSQLKPYFTSI